MYGGESQWDELHQAGGRTDRHCVYQQHGIAMDTPRVRKNCFSLVELVIVVVIIGIIAAIAIPRISRGAKGANDAALRGSLKALRDAIDRYAAEHGGEFPAQDKNVLTLTGQLTKRTNALGQVGTVAGEHIYGPYLRGMPPVSVPPNTGASGVEFKENGSVAMGGGDEDKGWMYNFKTGHIYANSDQADESGVDYKDY